MQLHQPICFVLWLSLLLKIGCGSGGSDSAPPTPTHTPTLSIVPASVELGPTSSVHFQGKLDGIDASGIGWTVEGTSPAGTIDPNGLYSAPAANGKYQVVATYQGQRQSATVTVYNLPYAASLAFNPYDIKRGESSKITINFGFGDGVLLPTVGAVNNGQTYTLSPLVNTEYTLNVTNRLGTEATPASGVLRVWDTGGYRSLPAMNTPRESHTATMLNDGRVLLVGGNNNQDGIGVGLASAELFDPNTNSFRMTGSMSGWRAGHTATLLKDGRVLVIGGWCDYGVISDTAEIYDPSTGTFFDGGRMAAARTGHSALLLPDGTVLVAGGRNMLSDLNFAMMEVYNPATKTFKRVRDMRYGRGPWNHVPFAMYLRDDGNVLIVGGTPYVVNGEIYHPATDTSDYLDREIKAGGVLLPGGQVFTLDSFTGYLLNLKSLDWVACGPNCLATIPDDDALAVLPNGKVVIACSTSVTSNIGGVFDPGLQGFNLVGPTLSPNRHAPTATTLPDGRVLVVGGYISLGKFNTTNFAECFDLGLGVLKP